MQPTVRWIRKYPVARCAEQLTLLRSLYARPVHSASSTRLSSQHQQVSQQIPVRGNGNVTVDIIQPINQPDPSIAHHILLHLPPGPFHAVAEDGQVTTDEASEDEDACVPSTAIPAKLAAYLPPSTTIVTVRYRLSASPLHRYKFPLPIHDVLTAFDWVRDTYRVPAAEQQSPADNPNTPLEKQQPTISIYGTRIGASLATMLSLTEYLHVHSTAISSPILNWVDLDERLRPWGNVPNAAADRKTELYDKVPKRKSKRKMDDLLEPTSVQRLLKVRDRLFTRPSSYFDPFASPMLMLRNPGRDCPVDNMFDDAETEDDVDRIMLSDLEQNYNYTDQSSVPDSGYESFGPYDDDLPVSNNAMIQRRKTLTKWPIVRPARSEKIKLIQPPYFNAILRDKQSGEARILKEQGEEFVELIGKCCFTKSQEQEYRERVNIERVGLDEGEDIEKKEAECAALWFQKMWKKTEFLQNNVINSLEI